MIDVTAPFKIVNDGSHYGEKCTNSLESTTLVSRVRSPGTIMIALATFSIVALVVATILTTITSVCHP